MKPLTLTIITPTYNMGHYIGRCLSSVCTQTYPYIEHIVMDNCSTDQTAEVVHSYQGKYNLTLIQKPDKGQADAINNGLDLATGDILCWLNADDSYVSEDAIQSIMAVFFQYPEVDIVTGKGVYTTPDGKILKHILLPKKLDCLTVMDPILQPATFWRKNDFRCDIRYHFVFDWDLFLKFYQSGLKYYLLDKTIASYQIDGMNKTACDTATRRDEIVQLLQSLRPRRVFNLLWCRYMAWGYHLAESRESKSLKTIFRYMNLLMIKLSGGRIWST